LPFQLAALIWFQPPTCCLLADAIPGNTLAASLLIQLIVGEIVVTPRTRLRAWNNPGNVRVLVTSLAGLVRLSDFGFFTTPGFLLLAFLLGAFARPFLLSDFGPVRHGESPCICRRDAGTEKGPVSDRPRADA